MNIAPFTIIIDTREQLPYQFRDIRIERCKAFVWKKIGTLKTGDYSIAGYENRVCVERKSLADLYGTLGSGRERFEREFERMQELDASLIVIEASWKEIAYPEETHNGNINFNWHSELNSNSVIGTIVSWSQKYPKTRWKAALDRNGGEKTTFQFLLNWYKNEK
jgi:ERCC4-type nuclease